MVEAGGELDKQLKAWATPKASPSGPDYARVNREESGGDDLATQCAKVSTWSTPTTQDAKNNGSPSQQSRDNLNSEAGGALNPDWVELLQGLPGNWTDLSGLRVEDLSNLRMNLRAWRKEQRSAKKG